MISEKVILIVKNYMLILLISFFTKWRYNFHKSLRAIWKIIMVQALFPKHLKLNSFEK